MKKKFVIAGITCSFFLISGICYSCAYNNQDTSAALVTSLTEGGEKSEIQSNMINEETDLHESNSTAQADEDQNSGLYSNELSSEGKKSQGKSYADKGSSEDDITTGLSKTEATFTEEQFQSANSSTGEALIYVHVCGAVSNPGVYEAVSGTRLFDLIALSGGFTKEAAGDYINQAQPVYDGQRIYIPTQDEVKELPVAEYVAGQALSVEQSTLTNTGDTNNTGSKDTSSTLVNINTANAEELMNLPGIGQAKANSIIDYRTTKGDFKTIEDLMSISGIKEGLFNQISSYIIAK